MDVVVDVASPGMRFLASGARCVSFVDIVPIGIGFMTPRLMRFATVVIAVGGPTPIHSSERVRETRVSSTIRPNAPLPSRELACTFDSNRLFLTPVIGSLIPMRIPFFADSSSPEHCASAMGALEPASDVLDTIAGAAQAAQPNDIRPRKRRS